MKDRLLKLRKLSQELRAHPDYIFADEATRQSIDDAIKNKIAQISGSEAGAFEKQAADIYAAEEKEIAETQKQQRADTNILQRYLGDVVGGIGRIGPALGKTAALGLSAIPGETGEGAARWLMEKSRDLEGKIDVMAPPPGFDFSSAGAAADTVVGNALNMLPAMAATGGTSTAMQGGRVANAAAKLAQGGKASRVLSKLIDPQTLATVGIMSAPGVMESATGKDFIGRAELPENPAMVAALSVPHALIETAFGVTPMDAAKLFGSKSISRGLMESVKRIRDKSGAEAAAKFFVKSVIKGGKEVGKTSFGEGSEEVMQGLIEIAAREFGNKDIPEAASGFMAEIGKPETWEDLGKNFVIGATVGMAISGGQKARDGIAKRMSALESQINDPKTTPEEAQSLAGMKLQLKEELASLREREAALKSSVVDRINEPAPLMLPDPDTALSTAGTMSDYEAYQQAKRQPAEPDFPATPVGILNKYVQIRQLPDTDPIKQAFMQMMAERGLVAPEQMQYPAGPEGDLLRRLDEAEIQQMQPQVAEGTYELPMLPFNSGKKHLPDGSIVQESPNALPQIAPPKAERIALKSGKPFANEKTAKAYQTKNNLQESHQVKPVEGGFVLDPVKVRKVATAKLQPNAGGVQIVDKSGQVPDYPVRKLVASGEASRIEKKLPRQPKAKEGARNSRTRIDYTVDTEDYGKKKVFIIRSEDGGATVFDDNDAPSNYNPEFAANKTDEEILAYHYEPAGYRGSSADVTLPAESKIAEPAQAEKKQWFIDADNMPVYTVKSDAMGYRGPYSKQEIKDLAEVDPSTLTEKNYGKKATLARREQAKAGAVVRPSSVDTPAQGSLASAQAAKKAPSEALKKPVVKWFVNYTEQESSQRTTETKPFDTLAEAKEFAKGKRGYITKHEDYARGGISTDKASASFVEYFGGFQPSAQEGQTIKQITGKDAPAPAKPQPAAKSAIGKLAKRISQFIDELKGKNLTPEQQGIYNVFTRKEKVYKIKDLKAVGEYVTVEGGRRKFGAQHVLIKHYGTNIAPVTAEEILQIGDIIRGGKVDFEENARVYTRTAEDGATLKVVVGKSTKDGSDTLITFHSQNRKAPTRATRESSALQGASQKADTSATSNIPTTVDEVKGAAPAKADKIEDFGEVLHGARKHYAQEFADNLAKSGDLEAQPFSKSWPEPDYQKLIDSGMPEQTVAMLRALRDSVPTRPRSSWKMNRWLAEAKKHKLFAEKMIAGEISHKDTARYFDEPELSKLIDLALLYDYVGHNISLKGAVIYSADYFNRDGKRLDVPEHLFAVSMPTTTANRLSNWRDNEVGLGKSKAEAIENFKKNLPDFIARRTGAAKKRATQFLVYQRTRGDDTGTFFIAYKTGSKVVELKSGFKTSKEAREFRDNNRPELEAILNNKREVKPERRLTNQPRTGKVRRGGDVSPQQFTETFGFRGVQFGNWVEGDRRQTDLNEAYDALTDLADVLDIPAKALSLDGALGLAFGARGKGGKNAYAAHYEPDTVVINLTKTKGAGSLAHEWWHALDNYFGGQGKFATVARLGGSARAEVKSAFNKLVAIVDGSSMPERSKRRDATRSKPYWSTDVEMSARAFESFILAKLSDAEISNDFLVNVVSEEAYDNVNEDYPYLLKSEIPTVKDAFTALFQTMKHEKTDKGVKLYSVEHLVADYAAKGLKQAAKIVRAGLNLIHSGAKTFAKWARQMVNEFGQAIHKHLKAIYADLQAFNKQLGKRGMIKMGSLGRPGFQTMRSVTAGSETVVRGASDVVNDPGAVYLPVNHFYADSQFEYGQYLQNKYKNRNLDYILSDLATDQEAQRYYAIEYAEETDPAFRGYADDEIIYRGNRIVTDGAELRRIMARNREKFKQQQLDAYRELAERENVWYGWTSLGKRGRIDPSIAIDGMKMLLDGLTKFTAWSKAMLDKYSNLADDALRRLYAQINRFLKMNTSGHLGLRGTIPVLNKAEMLEKTAKAKRLMQQSDLVWKKDDYRNAHLEFVDPITGIGETVATVRKNAKGQWELVGSTRAFLSLKTARTAVKSSIYEQLKQAEKNTEFYKQRQRDKKGVADQYFNQPTAEEKQAAKEAAKPKTFKDKVVHAVKIVDRVMANERQALEDMQAVIEKQLGRPLRDWENVAEIWDTIDGRIEERGNEFKAEFWQPIEKALVSNKISYDDFNEFLYAMHAKERNDYIREINPEFRARKVDGSGMSEQEAEDIKARLFAKYGEDTLMEIGQQFWGMHSKLLEIQEQYGLIDAETRKIIDGKYEYYTPLKRIVDEDQPFLLDQRATGRRSRAEHMLTFSEAAIDTTFGRGEHNKLYESIAGLMVSSPNPAVYEIDAGKAQAKFNDKTGEVEYRLNKRGDGEKNFYVKLNGQLATITVHDQQLFNAIKSRKLADKGLIATLVNGSRKLLMPLKAAATAWNTSFGPVNLLADTGLATVVAGTKTGGKFAWNQLKTIPKALKVAYQHTRGIDNADTRMYQEFLLNGGKTGFNAMYDIADKASEIQKRIEQGIKGGPGYLKSALVGIKNLVSAYNDILESGTRFAGYMTMRESGASAQKSAAYAKNLTVNFNKYGEWGRELNALFAFANPGLQGSKKVIAEVLIPLSKSRKGKAAIGAMIALGAVQEILAAIMSDFDDDEGKSKYDKLDAGLKDTHFIVMRPGTDGRYASFRLPYGLNVLPALGRNAAAYMLGSQTMTQTLSNIVGAATGAFSPLGNDNRLGFQAIPTALKLPVDLWTNTKWTGKKIKQDQPVLGPKVPNYQRYYDNTNQQLVSFFKWLNDLNGDQYTPGTINISPADAQYIVEFYFSGVARDPIKLVDAATNLVAGETPELADLPLSRRFFGKVKDYNVQDEFREYAQIAGNVSKAKNANDRVWLQKNRYALEIEKALSNTNKQMKAIEARKLPTKEERERLTQEMKRFNKFAREKVQKNLSKN